MQPNSSPDRPYSWFGDTLRRELKAKRASQAALAAELGVSAGMVSHYIAGRLLPARDQLFRIRIFLADPTASIRLNDAYLITDKGDSADVDELTIRARCQRYRDLLNKESATMAARYLSFECQRSLTEPITDDSDEVATNLLLLNLHFECCIRTMNFGDAHNVSKMSHSRVDLGHPFQFRVYMLQGLNYRAAGYHKHAQKRYLEAQTLASLYGDDLFQYEWLDNHAQAIFLRELCLSRTPYGSKDLDMNRSRQDCRLLCKYLDRAKDIDQRQLYLDALCKLCIRIGDHSGYQDYLDELDDALESANSPLKHCRWLLILAEYAEVIGNREDVVPWLSHASRYALDYGDILYHHIAQSRLVRFLR